MDEINKNDIGQRIKQIRVNRKETLEEFANAIRKETENKVKTTKSNVSKWEKGLNVPNDITIKAIANLGKVSDKYILTGDSLSHIFTEQSLLDSREETIELLAQQLSELTTVENTQEALVTEENFKYFISILIFLNNENNLSSLRSLRNNILKLSDLYQEYIFYDDFTYSGEFNIQEYLTFKENPTLKDKNQTINDFNQLKIELIDDLNKVFNINLEKLHDY